MTNVDYRVMLVFALLLLLFLVHVARKSGVMANGLHPPWQPLVRIDNMLAREVQVTSSGTILTSRRPGMLIISWDRCGHCVVLRKTFDILLETAPRATQQLRVAWLEKSSTPNDDTEELNRLERIGVQNGSYPRILGWKAMATHPIVYSGDRSVQSLQAFVQSMLS